MNAIALVLVFLLFAVGVVSVVYFHGKAKALLAEHAGPDDEQMLLSLASAAVTSGGD